MHRTRHGGSLHFLSPASGGLGCLLSNTLFFYSDLGYKSPLPLAISIEFLSGRGKLFSLSHSPSFYPTIFFFLDPFLPVAMGWPFHRLLLSPPYVRYRYLSTCLTKFSILFFFLWGLVFCPFGVASMLSLCEAHLSSLIHELVDSIRTNANRLSPTFGWTRHILR